MNKMKYFYDSYHYELKKQEVFYSQLTAQSPVMISNIGSIYFLSTVASSIISGGNIQHKVIFATFFISLLLSFCLSVASVYFNYLVFSGVDYKRPVNPDTYREYEKKCVDTYSAYPEQDQLVESAMSEFIEEQYGDAAAFNRTANNWRQIQMLKSTRLLFISTGFTIFSGVFATYLQS